MALLGVSRDLTLDSYVGLSVDISPAGEPLYNACHGGFGSSTCVATVSWP